MIRRVGGQIGRTVLDGVGRLASTFQEHKSLSADLLESDDAYLVVFDAPGATAADISVHFEDDVLSAQINRDRHRHDGYEVCFPGRGLTLKGEVELPSEASVDAECAEATVTKVGTLEVLIPKAEHRDVEVSDDGDGNDDGGEASNEKN